MIEDCFSCKNKGRLITDVPCRTCSEYKKWEPKTAASEILEAIPSISLRDYFAGQALAGMLAHPEACPADMIGRMRAVFNIADAMMAAREPLQTIGG